MKQLLKHMGMCCTGFVVTWCVSTQPAFSHIEPHPYKNPGYASGNSISFTCGTHISFTEDTTEPAAAPNLRRIEYYIDRDPGYNKATPVSFTKAANVSDIAINIKPAALSPGIHIFSIRAEDAKGAWSQDNKFLFAKPFPADTAGLAASPNLSRVEYYIDRDPGYNKATSVSFIKGTNLSDIAVNINPVALSPGIHLFGIRAKDVKGAWSQDSKIIFARPFPADTSEAAVASNLSRVEYYIDRDPGYDKATAVEFNAGTDLSDIAINIDPTALSQGIHLFGIRAKNAKGAWSLDNKWLFAKPYPDSNGPGPVPNLTNVEYYIDTDPGYGRATPVHFTAGISLSDIAIRFNTDKLTQGVHIFEIRAKDAKGAWSFDNKWLFARPYSPISTRAPKLLKVEYYIDKDPGYGKGVPVILRDSSNLSNIDLAINITGLSTGVHHLFIRSKDARKAWSLDNTFDFTVTTAITVPAIVINSVSRRVICSPDTFKIAYQATGVYNSGNIFKVQMSDMSGSFISPVIVGSFSGVGNSVITCAVPAGLPNASGYKLRIISTKPAVTGITSSDSISVGTTHPAPTITPAGIVNICAGNNTSLTASSGFATYRWSNGETSKSINVDGDGNYYVKVTDSYGCRGTSPTATVKIIEIPDTLFAISGPISVTALALNVSYNVTAIPGFTYIWTLPAGASITSGEGTAAIKVKWGITSGIVSVTASNYCGTSAVSQLSVTIDENITASRPFTAPLKEEIGLYPNPASSTAMLVFTTTKADNYYIEITDITGKALLIKSGKSFYGINKVTLDVSKFSNGIYIVNLKDKQHIIRSMKLNKQA